MTRGLIAQPGNTDSFYHFNAAHRLVQGQGLTDPYLWTYIGLPESLPAPSHLYWMPLTALSAALGMALLNQPGDYAAAQLPFTMMFFALAWAGYWLGLRLGGTRRHAWVAGLLTVFSGFFTRFWGTTDTFAPYALAGSLCLVCMGKAAAAPQPSVRWYALAGALAGLGHLTRADGVLLLLVGWAVIFWPGRGAAWITRPRLLAAVLMTAAYLLVMLPWFVRNLQGVGVLLPVGGAQGFWYTEYNDLFNYPPEVDPASVPLGRLLAARWEAFTNNLATFIAVEGFVVMMPLMLVALWRRRRDGFLRGFWLYALGLHLLMTLVFPFAGYRGGLLHSAAALVPWWAALAVLGVDDVVAWAAARRKRWQPAAARRMFSAGLVCIALFLSLYIGNAGRVPATVPRLYPALRALLPADAVVMINDPAQLYYFTGLRGVVLPNAPPEVILEIARRYGVTHLVIEGINEDGRQSGAAPAALWPLLYTLPDFLVPLPLEAFPAVRVYALAAP